MKIKDFIKPTLAKIILTIILFLISPMMIMYFGGGWRLTWFFSIKVIRDITNYNPTTLPIILLASYIVSLILVYLYKKVREK